MDIEELKKTLEPANVKSRSKGSFNLSYIEGWWAIMEANRIFDFDGWDRDTMYNKEVCRSEYDKQGTTMYKVGYEAKVSITVFSGEKTITRMGTGHGSGIAKDLFDAIEGAAKEAETDAMKRALMTFGSPFGLALYDKTQRYVQVNPEPINQERVDGCYEMLKGEIDGDNDEPDYERMQTGISRISNDERLAVFDKFSKEKPEGAKRMYATIISDCLKKKEIDGVWQ